jgi:hypothetical protein
MGNRIQQASLSLFLLSGFSCSEIGLVGDTGIDGDASDTTTSTDAAWDPAIEGMGEPGWRDSTVPFCRNPEWMFMSWDVWSDSRGVFVIVEESNPGGSHWPPDSPDEASNRHFIAFNDGRGWSERFGGIGYSDANCFSELTGIPGGSLILRGPYEETCDHVPGTDGGLVLEYMGVTTLYIVDETLGYALIGSLLLYYDGTSWGPYPPDPLPYGARAMWANRTALYLAGGRGVVMSEEDGGWRIHDTRTIEDITTIWGFGDEDIWVGTETGRLMHYDGTTWEWVEWPNMGDSTEDSWDCRYRYKSIRGMWGADGILYFHTENQLAMWDGVEFSILGYWPGEDVWHPDREVNECVGRIEVNAIWGNATDEVFISVHDPEHVTEDCGSEYLLWWDGHEFHWF